MNINDRFLLVAITIRNAYKLLTTFRSKNIIYKNVSRFAIFID